MISIAIHGGAGVITRTLLSEEKEKLYQEGLKMALDAGFLVLQKKGSALDAVEAAVMCLEDNPMFNAGKGSVFNHQGKHEMDASIMSGRNLEAGAVSLVSNIKNPIRLARTIMEKSQHVFMAGAGAEEFARLHRIEMVPEDYFYDKFRWDQWKKICNEDKVQLDHSDETEKKFGTVGAVAIDSFGNLAAATSTGGMTNKKYGRIGDSPLIGAGTYANNNTCAVSCTGHGELFIRSVVAYDISCLMEYKNYSLQQACYEVVMKKLVDIGGEGGLIAIDKLGNICMPFNSEGMYRAWRSESGEEISIFK